MPPARKSTTAPKLWVVLARAYNALSGYLEQRVAAEGLGLSDFAVLEALLHKGPLTMSAIAGKVLLANASMTSAVDRMEKRGFVKRAGSDADRRVRMVDLTARGRKFISPIYERHEREIESVMEDLSMTERSQLRALLKKLGLAASAASKESTP